MTSALPPKAARSNRLWLWMVPILLLVFTLGAIYLNRQPLWGDERNTVQSTGGVFTPQLYTLPEVWQDIPLNHPQQLPGYQTLLNLWMRLAGTEPGAIRMLSVFFVFFGTAWMYRLGWLVGKSRRAGVYAALLFATSMLVVYYSTRVRTYSLIAGLTVFVLYVYLRIITRRQEPSRKLWAALVVGVTVLLYSHYLVLLLLAAIGVNHLLLFPQARRTWPRRWWGVVLAFTLAGLVYLPWLPNLIHGVYVETTDPWQERGLSIIRILGVLADFFGNGVPLLAILTLVVIVLTPDWRRLRHIYGITILVVALVMSYFVISQRMTTSRASYMIELWPLLIVLFAVAVARLEQAGRLRRLVADVLLIVFVATGVYARLDLTANVRVEGFRYIFPVHVADLLLHQNDIVGDRVVVTLPDVLASYEALASRISAEDSRTQLKLTSYREIEGMSPEDFATALSDVDQRERLWIAYSPNRATSASAAFAEAIVGQFQQCPRSMATSLIRMDQYAQSLTCCLDEMPPTPIAQFGEDIALLKAGLPTEPVHGTLSLDLLWALSANVPPEQYSVSVKALALQGDKFAQKDYGLKTGSRPCDRLELDTTSLLPGAYTVALTVYDWRSGQRLPGTLGSAAPTTELLPLGSVTVS